MGLNGDLALPALANAYLVEDAAAAERLAGAYPECHFLTRTGEHYQHRLVSGGKGSSAGPLALRRDFRELERRTAELEGKIRASEAALAEAAGRAAQLAKDHANLTAAKQEAEKKAVVADEKLRQTREACERAREQLKILQSEAAALRTRARRSGGTQSRPALRTGSGRPAKRAAREEAITQSTGSASRTPRGAGTTCAGARRGKRLAAARSKNGPAPPAPKWRACWACARKSATAWRASGNNRRAGANNSERLAKEGETNLVRLQ